MKPTALLVLIFGWFLCASGCSAEEADKTVAIANSTHQVPPDAFSGSISGKVILKGTQPPEKVIVMDELCCKAHTGKTFTTRHYVVGKDGGLANVYVYISKGLEGKKFDPPKEAAVLDQKDCMYEPYVQGIMVGQPLKIRNSDPLLHNVHTVAQPQGNKEINLAQANQGRVDVKVFNRREVMLKFKCDIHNWMFAYVGIMDHPYFAVSDKDGSFRIPNLPPGEYTLTAFHPKSHAGTAGISQTIKVEDKPVTANFEVEVFKPIK